MKRIRLVLALGAVGLAAVCLFPVSETAFEFDCVNFRLRECSRYRSWRLGIVLWERYSSPSEHPTAVRLRMLGVLPPIREDEARWLLVKELAADGNRSSKGWGGYYLQVLGETSFGTPVGLPTSENLDENIWIRWAMKDTAAAIHFWQQVRSMAIGSSNDQEVLNYLEAAHEYLEVRKVEVVGAEIEAYARQATR